MAYFDNAATTFPKPECVYAAMDEFYRRSGGSVGRGSYGKALSARSLVDETRQLVGGLLHCPAKQVVYTPTATIALNMVIQAIIATGAKTFTSRRLSIMPSPAFSTTLRTGRKSELSSFQSTIRLCCMTLRKSATSLRMLNLTS